MTLKYAGIKVKGDQVSHKQGSGPVVGTTARVESAGEIDRRLSATRVILTGPLGLFWKKKKDSRQVFLTVEGPGYSIVEEVGPKDQKAARQFASKLSALASAATAKASRPTPAAPLAAPVAATLAQQPLEAPPAPAPAPDLLAQLKQLGDLRDAGVLTDAEFTAQKTALIGTPVPDQRRPPPPELGHLPPPPT